MIYIFILWLAIMAAVLSLAWQVVKPKKRANLTYISGVAHTNPGLAGLWHQLLIRLNFNVEKAELLIGQLKQRYPNKSDRQLIEKAIWMIEAQKSKQRLK